MSFSPPLPKIVAALFIGAILVTVLGVALSPAVRSRFEAGHRRASGQLSAALNDWRVASPPAEVRLHVDISRPLRAISPLIYGVSVAGREQLTATDARLNRWGGNPNTRYNWARGSAWNAGRDWEFRNVGGQQTGPSSSADTFVALNRSLTVASLITVPAIGWVAKNGDTDVRSRNVPPAGGAPFAFGVDAIADYEPAENRALTSVRSSANKGRPFVDQPAADSDHVYQDEWVYHLVGHFGAASASGVGFYAVDNEPDLWAVTHTDIHPVTPSYEDTLGVFLEYAEAIKSVDPSAQVLGPSLSGWTGYFYSARDRGDDNFRTHADRASHADMPFLPWWLDMVRQHDEHAGHRTLDFLDVHYYPQAPGVYSGADDESSSRRRLRSTRSLWDPDYVDESWIGEPVRLIPRMKAWIDRYYPNTRLAIGEWNWGADHTMNGALAIADVLGIYGREGVDMAAYWTSPAPDSPGAQAFAMYTNYDGHGHGFGDLAISARSDSPDDVVIYASSDSTTGDVLLMVINQRADADLNTTVDLSAPVVGRASFYRYGSGDVSIREVGTTTLEGSELRLALPASSITLVRVERHP